MRGYGMRSCSGCLRVFAWPIPPVAARHPYCARGCPPRQIVLSVLPKHPQAP